MKKILLFLSISMSIQQADAQAFEKENNFVQVKFCLRLAFKRLVNLAFFLVQNDARII